MTIRRHTHGGGSGHHIVPQARPVPAEIARNIASMEEEFAKNWWQGGVVEFIKRAADRTNKFVQSVRGYSQPAPAGQ